ncbi:MAG: SH3 domain-containing protein [Clostridia bacterium]|nr:SH3 domain-containing protein [Clostridia bacterium]
MKKTNLGLVEYAKAQLGKPYWYGTYGQKSGKSLYNQKKKQYPKFYTASDFKNQYGVKVHDCIGLIKGYIWSDSPCDGSPKYATGGCPDVNEEMLYSAAKVKGTVGSMPEIAGVCVLKQGHIGVYIGNGEVIEARGHAYGVVKTKFSERGWKKWCLCPYIEYEQKSKKSTKMVTVKTNGSVLNCRKKPSIFGRIIGSFKNGQKLTLIEKTNKNWWKVKSGSVTGYCNRKWLKEE